MTSYGSSRDPRGALVRMREPRVKKRAARPMKRVSILQGASTVTADEAPTQVATHVE